MDGKQKGFTLIEILVVVTIIGVLAGLVVVLIPKGQFEAARSLGLPARVMWLKVVLPQAVKIVIPPLIGTVISIFKATAILSVLAINDVMRAAQRISSYTCLLYTSPSPRDS